MARKAKASSIEGAVEAMQNVLADPLPPPWPLNRKQKPIWDEILLRRGRDEWQPVDLRFAWELAGVIVRLKEEESKLSQEGYVLETDKGAKTNPRFTAVRLMSMRAIALARYLRIHPGSDYRDPSLVRGMRQAEQEARTAIASPTLPKRPPRPTVDARRRARLLPQ